MDSSGMMAVVRGTPDAGLMVTLVDGGRRYTLMPQAEMNPPPPQQQQQQRGGNMLSQHSQYSRSDVRAVAARCDSGAQAVDDRYTSNYKIQYCHTKPTSPPVELTEFPPQRAHLQPGQENFQVGGYPLKNFATRTISKCQERGPYPIPRISTSNAFENSLRKYPCATPESSSEVVERLISFSKFTNSSTSPIENELKLQNCVTCYQVSRKGKSVKYKNRKQAIPWRQGSPTRDKDLLTSEGNQAFKYHDNNKSTLFCKDIVAMGNVITSCRNHVDGKQMQQGGNVASDNVNSASESTKKSLIDIPMSTFEDKHEVAPNEDKDNQQTAIPRNKYLNSFSLQNIRSMQMINSVIVAGGTKKKTNYCKLKKIKSPKQSHTKCKKLKHKSRLCKSELNKLERKRLKAELLNLIRQCHSSQEEDKLELKIKTVLYKLIDFTLDTKKNHSNTDVIIKHCMEDSNRENKTYRNGHDATVDDLKHNIKSVLNNRTNDVTEIHRIILEEMIPLLKYQVFKEHENKVLKFILSKVIKDIVDIIKKIGDTHSVNSKNSLEYRYHLNKLKEICGNKKLLYGMHNTSQIKKYCRYLNAIRKLVKSDDSWPAGNLTTIFKKPTDLKLRSVINIYRALKRIQSTTYLQAQYVTNMLLNQFCNVGSRCNDKLNYYGAVRKTTSALKCLSDTYIVLRDSSKNKSTLTKSKIDKMNLYSTKLLTNIKNKCTIVTNIENPEKKIPRLNANNPYKQGSICVNDICSIPLSFQNSEKKPDVKEEHNLNVGNKSLLGQVEEKVNTWLNKFDTDSSLLSNNNYHSCNLKDLSIDLANQLKYLKANKTLRIIKKENVADCFRCVICKHLFVKFDDHSFELVKKVSELIKDLLNIYTFDNPQLSQLHHQQSQVPCTSIGNYDACLQHASPTPKSRLIQAESSLIEDIYLKVPFCDESVRQVFPNSLSKDDGNNKNINTDILQHQYKYLDIEEVKNRSGVINVALASAKSDKGENTAPNIKCNKTCSVSSNRKKSNSNLSRLNNNDEQSCSITDEPKILPDNLTRQQLHEYCVEIFRNLCKELPILATKPDLTELAREGVLHNILKIFYMLQGDPDVDKNCTYFELCFDDEIGGLLDILPQTKEMKLIRKKWTKKLVAEAVNIFEAMNCVDDTECTGKCNEAATNGRKSVNEQGPENKQIAGINVLELVDQFLISANLQEQNYLIGKVYKYRLINRTNEIYDNLKRKDSNTFDNLLDDDIKKVIFKELESVPKPNCCEISKEEMDLAKLNIEIEKWVNELPIKPSETINDDERKLKIHELTQKIYVIESCIDPNESSSETDVEQEICMFICSMIDKIDDKDMNVNLMIEELMNRIRKLRQESTLDYETFKKDLPFNSTAIQQENNADRKSFKQCTEPCSITNNTLNPNERNDFKIQNEEENITIKEDDTKGTLKDNTIRLRSIAKTAAKGILGSQIPRISQEGCCPKPRHSPATASLYTPLTSSPRRNTYESDQLCDKSKWGQFSSRQINSINTDRRASTQFSTMDHNQRPDEYFTRRSLTRNNFISVPRQASSKGSMPIGHNYGTASTAQAPPFIPVQSTDNQEQRYYRNTSQIESERERDQNERVRCHCGDRHYRRRRRYDCCCEDYISMPHCYLPPYEHYF